MSRKRRPSSKVTAPDVSLLKGTVDAKLLTAARRASEALTSAGIRHALIGGLAVGAYGYARATKDIDFVLSEDAFETHAGGVITMRPGIPFESGGYLVDTLSDPEVEPDETFLDGGEGIPVVSLGALIFLKLKSFRRRDKEDIIELLRSGADEDEIAKYLETFDDPKWLQRFDELANLADEAE